MADSNKLIPDSTLAELERYNSNVDKAAKVTENLLAEAIKLTSEFSKYGTTFKSVNDLIEKHADLEKKLSDSQNNFNKALQEQEAAIQKTIQSNSAEVKSIQEKTKAYQDNAKSVQDNAKTLKDISAQAYEITNKSIDQQYKELIKLNQVLAAEKDQLSAISKEYKNGKLTRDEYISQSTILNRDIKDQKSAVSSLSKEIQLSEKIINTHIGSYDNLSAQYSLIKIRINQMGEAEGDNVKVKRQLEAQAKALYEQMSNLQKATGKNTLDVGKYDLANKDLLKTLSMIDPKIGGIVGKLKEFSANNMEVSSSTGLSTKAVGLLTLGFAALTAGIGIAIGAIKSAFSALKEFALEGVEMATKIDGISNAFKSLNQPDLLKNLREATKGTINDLKLMKSAVQSKDFKIPLNDLGNILKFVQVQANRTGEDFEKLREQIILGIGKESTQRLDEFGIKASEIKEQISKLGSGVAESDKFRVAVLELINQRLAEQGDLAITAADKEAQAAVKRENAQLKVGETLIGIKNIWSTLSGSFYEVLGNLAERYLPAIISRLEDVINRFIALYNSSEEIRKYVGVLYVQFNIFFSMLKRDTKIVIDAFGTFADVTKSILKLDFEGAGNAYKSFLSKTHANTQQFIGETLKATLEGRKLVKKTLEPIQLSSIKSVNPVTGGGNKNGSGDVTDEQKKQIEAELKAAQELADLKVKIEGEALKKIITDNKQSYEERIKAADEFENRMSESINKRLNEQLKDEKLTKSQIALLELKAQEELNKISEEGSKYRIQVTKDYVDSQNKLIKAAYDERVRGINESESEDLLNLANRFKDGAIKQTEYENEKLEITKKYAKERLEVEIASLEEMLLISGLSAEEQDSIQKKIAEARLKYTKHVNSLIVKDNEDSSKKQIKLDEDLANRRRKILSDILKESLKLVSTLFEAETKRNLEKLDKQSEDNDKWRERELQRIEEQEEAGLITKEQADAQKEAIDFNAEKREEELDRQRKQIQITQAKREKAFSLADIAINTASAIMKNTAQLGYLAAIPINVLTGVLGGIQAATILAQPLPQYAKGTDDHIGGWAITGDGGKNEMVITPDNKIFKTPDKPTLTYMPEHSMVLPDYTKALANLRIGTEITPQNNNTVIFESKKQLKALEGVDKTLKLMNRNMNLGNEALQREMIKNNRLIGLTNSINKRSN